MRSFLFACLLFMVSRVRASCPEDNPKIIRDCTSPSAGVEVSIHGYVCDTFIYRYKHDGSRQKPGEFNFDEHNGKDYSQRQGVVGYYFDQYTTNSY